MAKRKPGRSGAKRKPARGRPARARVSAAKAKKSAKQKAAKRPAAKRAAARPRRRSAPARPAPATWSRIGVITHTELASGDPVATQAWCERVLGWSFLPPAPMPGGEYRMWRFANETGGGIRSHEPPEAPGTVPYCEIADIHATYAAALAAGAEGMMPPAALPGGMGWIAVVRAPGGVAIGLWAAK